jgi:4-hydroxythreonine-4-phosphate dehydrogenase
MLQAWQQAPDRSALRLTGDPRVWLRAAGQLGLDDQAVEAACTGPAVDERLPPMGRSTPGGARLAWAALDASLARLDDGSAKALVTGPIAKAGMLEIGFPYPGHTEYLAAYAGAARVLMVMSAPRFHVGLHTVHIPLRNVPKALSPAGIAADLRLLAGWLAAIGESGTIGVCGLNPHAGEDGALGHEEDSIRAGMAGARAAGIAVDGPLPGDTAFVDLANGRLAAVLAMYHDQGLAPFKLRHFHDGVNVSVGLPWLRTSPDHGTAFSLAAAGPQAADPASAIAALGLAARGVGASRPDPLS